MIERGVRFKTNLQLLRLTYFVTMGKRKRQYIVRDEVLKQLSNRVCNSILPLQVNLALKKTIGSYERHFTHQLIVDSREQEKEEQLSLKAVSSDDTDDIDIDNDNVELVLPDSLSTTSILVSSSDNDNSKDKDKENNSSTIALAAAPVVATHLDRDIRLDKHGDFLVANVMLNEICVLFLHDDVIVSVGTTLAYDVTNDGMHGKRKKGASQIKAGTVICTLTASDGSGKAYKSPISGQLIEVNDSLLTNNSSSAGDTNSLDVTLLNDKTRGERYIAIIYPNTKLPNESVSWQDIYQQQVKSHSSTSYSNEKVCYQFGTAAGCSRGSGCKFVHAE